MFLYFWIKKKGTSNLLLLSFLTAVIYLVLRGYSVSPLLQWVVFSTNFYIKMPINNFPLKKFVKAY
jgi:predicted membrane metal-binding protein